MMRKDFIFMQGNVFVLILNSQNIFMILEERLSLNVLAIPMTETLYKRVEISLRLAVRDSRLPNDEKVLCESSSAKWYSVPPRKQIMKHGDEIPTRVLAVFKASGDSTVL